MSATAVDVVVGLLVVVAVVSGVRRGAVRGAAAWTGVLAGAVVALGLVAAVGPRVSSPWPRAAVVAALVVGGILVGRLIGTGVGDRLADREWRSRPGLRRLDAVAGGVLAGTSVLVISWLVLETVVTPFVPATQGAVEQSRVLGLPAGHLPAQWAPAVRDWGEQVLSDDLPRILGEPVLPPPRAVSDPSPAPVPESLTSMVDRTQNSIVKISGLAPECEFNVTGTGIVYAPGRVLTADHVVAGVETPYVESGASRLPARVVYADPRRDVAVLAVRGLAVEPLPFDYSEAPRRSTTVVAGYPNGGPFSALDGRVADVQELVSAGGEGTGEVSREVYKVRAPIVSGFSGGPMLSPQGHVYGMVFAAARYSYGTGFAMTASYLSDAISAGATATKSVSAGRCHRS